MKESCKVISQRQDHNSKFLIRVRVFSPVHDFVVSRNFPHFSERTKVADFFELRKSLCIWARKKGNRPISGRVSSGKLQDCLFGLILSWNIFSTWFTMIKLKFTWSEEKFISNREFEKNLTEKTLQNIYISTYPNEEFP